MPTDIESRYVASFCVRVTSSGKVPAYTCPPFLRFAQERGSISLMSRACLNE
jgi:hypothetical protein